jgi:prepilin-type N-terminal cleavage/methylation domain-containing protein
MRPRKIRRRDVRRGDPGFTLIELLMVIAIIAIIAAIAIPGLMRARTAANEGSAIASIRTISSAQATFASSCGGGGFAQSLADLGRAPMGNVAFLPADLAGGRKTGYDFELQGLGTTVMAAADTCNGSVADTTTGFLAIGNPSVDGDSGVRAFGLANGGVLRSTATAAGITNIASYLAAPVLN